MDDNKRFWSKTAKLYERFTRGKKSSARAYQELEQVTAAQLNHTMHVLELAAGPAMLSKAIASACATLEVTDFSPEMLAQAEKKGLPTNVTFAIADATKLQYQAGKFDAVVIANALHIMPEPVRAIKEIKRVVKADGIIIAPTFTRDHIKSHLIERLMEAIGFKTFSRWTHKTYLNFLRKQGLIVVKQKVITGHNFPISFVVCKKKNNRIR
ncbi:MAG: class I SAM-dependent methyltransferase [bacterium]|nr:class I SAM-dependent methyltransferase [bacterium]